MTSCLLWLKAWIAHWRPHDGKPPRFPQYCAAILTVAAILLLFPLLIVRFWLRGPLKMRGHIPGNGTMHCELPDVVQFYVFLFGIWEPDISAFVQRRLTDGGTFCDVGSHVGYYALLASKQVGNNGQIVAVEASPSVFRQLQKNICVNDVTNVRAVNVAAAAEPGLMNVHLGPAWNLGWTTTRSERKLPLECQVPALPLPEILTPAERRSLRLIKVDVEGTERELFAGLVTLLAHAPPDAEVVIELSPRWWKESPMTVEQTLQPFFELGYHVYLLKNDYSPWRYIWSDSIQPPRRARHPIRSWIGQHDVVLSRLDQDEL